MAPDGPQSYGCTGAAIWCSALRVCNSQASPNHVLCPLETSMQPQPPLCESLLALLAGSGRPRCRLCCGRLFPVGIILIVFSFQSTAIFVDAYTVCLAPRRLYLSKAHSSPPVFAHPAP